MIGVRLVDGRGTGHAATVGADGQLAVGLPIASNPLSLTLVAAAGAHNVRKPVVGKEYRISDIVITTNKNVGVDGALVTIYEATSEDETSVAKQILVTQILKNDKLALNGLCWKVTEGRFLNAKTDDDTVYLTIASHLMAARDDNPAALGTGEDV